MKKLTAMLLTAICAANVSVAQETVTGVVVDKKGNPLPGVRIEVPGTPDQTISDLDGTFTLYRSDQSKKKVYATYAGMNPKKVKIKDGMRIKMKEYNWWTKKPDKWNWFVNAIVAVPNNPFVSDKSHHVMNPAYGIMFGRVKNWGYYVKGITNTFNGSLSEWNEETSGFIDKQKSTYWSATGGAIVRLGCPIHLYVGAGYSDYTHCIRNMSGEWFDYSDSRVKGLNVEYGLMLRIRKVMVSLGASWGNATDEDKCAGNFGIGYTF